MPWGRFRNRGHGTMDRHRDSRDRDRGRPADRRQPPARIHHHSHDQRQHPRPRRPSSPEPVGNIARRPSPSRPPDRREPPRPRPSLPKSARASARSEIGLSAMSWLRSSRGAWPTEKTIPAALKRRSFMLRHPFICAAIAVIFTVILIAAIIGIAIGVVYGIRQSSAFVTVTPTSPTERPNGTYFDAVCSIDKPPGIELECVVGKPPASDSCRARGHCHAFVYEIDAKKATFVDRSFDFPEKPPAGAPAFCKDQKQKLSLCSENGTCDRAYDGVDDQTWYSDGVWEDTCDVPNPCWGTTALNTQWSRRDCRSESGDAVSYIEGSDAMVWIQHLRCKVGHNQTASRPCKGPPFKLWLCKEFSPSSICGSEVMTKDGCKYTCGPGVPNEPLPLGARCQRPDDPGGTKAAYCVNDMCLFATPIDLKEVLSYEDCMRRRES